MYTCDICSKSYKFKRNLTHHIDERHGEQYYFCPVPNCAAHFCRRGYLKDHLCNTHKFSKDSARERIYSVKRQSNLIQNVRSPYIPDCEPITEEDNLDEFNVLDEEFFTFLDDNSKFDENGKK